MIWALTSSTVELDSLPDGAYLVHACNCMGTWGAGVALAIKNRFPAAYEVYRSHCQSTRLPGSRWPTRNLAGQCLVIPPQAPDITRGSPSVHIVCLLTSWGYASGRGRPKVDSPHVIISQTDAALACFRQHLDSDNLTVDIYSPRFNSGRFNVPWEATEEAILDAFDGYKGRWFVLAPPRT